MFFTWKRRLSCPGKPKISSTRPSKASRMSPAHTSSTPRTLGRGSGDRYPLAAAHPVAAIHPRRVATRAAAYDLTQPVSRIDAIAAWPRVVLVASRAAHEAVRALSTHQFVRAGPAL